jgi:[ribosomal protein S5]-alanine N-acetyltransferase
MTRTQSERLTLRPVTTSDVDDLFRIYGDPATNTFNPAGPYPNPIHAKTVLARWVSHWKENAFGNWAISLHEAPEKVIGFGGLSISTYAGITINNLGYRFATEAWGKGLATEFSRYAVRYGFEKLQLEAISGVVRGNHLASQKVLTKAGLKYVREISDIDNAPPSLLFTLTLDEWCRK